jgi:Mg2+/Co2+ transporter CorC
VRDRDVLEEDVEFRRALVERVADLLRDLLASREELLRVLLRDGRLEHLVDDGGEDALVKVLAELDVDGRERLDARAREHAERDLHLLEVLRARARRDDAVAWGGGRGGRGGGEGVGWERRVSEAAAEGGH